MKQVNIIHTDAEHERAMARVLKLMDLDPAPDTPEADELELLGMVIQRYERQHFPMGEADPIDVIKFMMDQQGLKKKDLIPYIGSASKVSEVLKRKRKLGLGMIRRLSAGMGIPVGALIQVPGEERA